MRPSVSPAPPGLRELAGSLAPQEPAGEPHPAGARLPGARMDHRKAHRERGALPWPAGHEDLSAQQAHVFLAEGQAQSGPAVLAGGGAVRLGELLEDPGHLRRRHADAGVRNREADVAGILRVRVDPDGDRPVLGELRGIAEQVVEGLVQQLRIRPEVLDGGIGVHHQAVAVPGHEGSRGGGQLHEEGRDMAGLDVDHHPPGLDLGEVQDVVDEAEQVPAGRLDVAQVPQQLAQPMLGKLLQQEFTVEQDGVERRPQLMAHVGQEHALGTTGLLRGVLGLHELHVRGGQPVVGRLELVPALQEGVLGLLALGDVPVDRIAACAPARDQDGGADDGHMEEGSVLPPADRLEGEAAALDGQVRQALGLLPVGFGDDQVVDGAAADLGLLVAEHPAELRVLADDPAVDVQHHDAFGRGLDEVGEVGRLPLDGVLGALAVGDIPVDAEDGNLPGLGHDGHTQDGDIDQGAVLAPPDVLDGEGPAAGDAVRDGLGLPPQPRRGQDVVDALAEQLVLRVPEQQVELAVRPHDQALVVADHDGFGHVLEEVLEESVPRQGLRALPGHGHPLNPPTAHHGCRQGCVRPARSAMAPSPGT